MRQEADAILSAIPLVAGTFASAIPHLVCRTPVLFSGMGKSGIIAQKAASTFRSLGIPSHYVHPGDASHGDLGCIHGDAVMVLLSNSGDTPELADLIFFCRRLKVPILALTGKTDSALAEAADVTLCYGKVEEACSIGLAPTTSTTVALAVCDALAVEVAAALKVTPAMFRLMHPGGKLGVRLRTASTIMKSPVPVVNLSAPFPDIVTALTGDVSGAVVVLDWNEKPVGIITDGDLRRSLDNKGMHRVAALTAFDMMTREYLSVTPDMRADEVASFMNRNRITKVVVRTDVGDVVGLINLHDAMRGT